MLNVRKFNFHWIVFSELRVVLLNVTHTSLQIDTNSQLKVANTLNSE